MVFEKLAEILEDIFELDEGEVSLQTRFEEDLYADMQDTSRFKERGTNIGVPSELRQGAWI